MRLALGSGVHIRVELKKRRGRFSTFSAPFTPPSSSGSLYCEKNVTAKITASSSTRGTTIFSADAFIFGHRGSLLFYDWSASCVHQDAFPFGSRLPPVINVMASSQPA